MNIKNLKLLVNRLEAQLDSPEAARFNMQYFGNIFHPARVGVLPGIEPVCKTQACLAGETVLATGTGKLLSCGGIEVHGHSGFYILNQATRDLDLNKTQANNLFFFNRMLSRDEKKGKGWPAIFEQAYENAKTPQGRLYVAIRRVEHFIKTKGRE